MKNKYHIYIGLIITLLIIVPLSYSLDRSRIDIGANIMNDIGLSGKYNTICLIDDGVDYTHPNLGNCSISQISSGACSSFIAGTDLADNDNDPFPEGNQQHGTQLAGIILSNHSIYKGIAGNSKIAIVRVFNYNFSSQQSETNVSLILNGLQWCIDNKYQYNISVISMSLGIGFGLPIDLTREFQDKINNATNKNILVIKSSGNREAMDNYSMTFPAELDNVTSVGSSTNNEISYFTRRTSGMDLLAPGDKIRSTIPGGNFNSFLGDLICWHNGEFISGLVIIRDIIPFCNYGTSFSAPHVSASVTLVKEYDPALKPFDIDKQLKESGDGIYDSVTGLTFKKINLPNFFHLYDWPTNRHDNRRTGTTLLKGDMKKAGDYVLKVENREDTIRGIQIGDEKYVIDLVFCHYGTRTCIFKINGVNSHPLHAYKKGLTDNISSNRINDHFEIKVDSIIFDKCDNARFCNMHFEAYNEVNLTVIGDEI